MRRNAALIALVLFSCARVPKMPDEPAVVMRQMALKEVVSGVNPVDATWIGVSDPGQVTIFDLERCGQLFVGTESGASLRAFDASPSGTRAGSVASAATLRANAATERTLLPLHSLRAFGPSHIEITPKGPTCVVHLRGNGCVKHPQAFPPEDGREDTVTWANGTMSATLSHSRASGSVSGEASELYFGRLEGTATVKEHVHEASWEILFPYEASGDVTVSGEARRVVPYEVVAIPPGAKHAWKPDAGTTLRAFQVYTPAGPEERFREFAARDAAVSPMGSARAQRVDAAVK